MNYVTILWSGAGAAALMLAVVHGAVSLYDRQARSSAALAAVALSLVGVAYCELRMMGSQTPAEFLQAMRWCHLPLFFLFSSICVFVRLHFGTGRLWLLWSVIGIRALILLINFAMPGNFNFTAIGSLRTEEFLGSPIALIGDATVNPWQWLALLSCVLFLAFVADATRGLWAKGDVESRRTAAVVGGSVLLFVSLSVLSTQLTIWGVFVLPMSITPIYLVILLAMAFELSRDTLRARRLVTSLMESDNRLELAMSATDLGLWSWESRSGIIWATERARSCFGFADSDKVEFDAVRAKIHDEDFARVAKALQSSIESGARWGAEFRVCTPGNPLQWVAAQGQVVVDDRGKPKYVRGVLRDISEQKQAQAETAELRREVNHVGRVSMLGQLSSSLAHELSQPLSAILRNVEAAEILMSAPHPDLAELRAILVDIHKDDRRAGDIIDRLRALLKRRQLQFLPLAVDSLIKDVCSLVRADAASRHIEFTSTTEERLPSVSGDRVHLSQVLINLLLNGMDAIGASAGGRRKLTLDARRGDGETVDILVEDTGPGIADEIIGRIFDPFFTTKASGMGMGLAVSRTIIESHGGKLRVSNAPQGGAVFIVTLPGVRAA